MAARRTTKSNQAPAAPKYLGVFVTEDYQGNDGEEKTSYTRVGAAVPPQDGMRLQHRDHRWYLGQRQACRASPASARGELGQPSPARRCHDGGKGAAMPPFFYVVPPRERHDTTGPQGPLTRRGGARRVRSDGPRERSNGHTVWTGSRRRRQPPRPRGRGGNGAGRRGRPLLLAGGTGARDGQLAAMRLRTPRLVLSRPPRGQILGGRTRPAGDRPPDRRTASPGTAPPRNRGAGLGLPAHLGASLAVGGHSGAASAPALTGRRGTPPLHSGAATETFRDRSRFTAPVCPADPVLSRPLESCYRTGTSTDNPAQAPVPLSSRLANSPCQPTGRTQ